MAQNAYWGGNIAGFNKTPQQIINNQKWKSFNLKDWTKNKLNEKNFKTPTTTKTNTNNNGWGTKKTTTKKTTAAATPTKVERDFSMFTPESVANYQSVYDYQIGKWLSDSEAYDIASGLLEMPRTKPTTTQKNETPTPTKVETPAEKVETPKEKVAEIKEKVTEPEPVTPASTSTPEPTYDDVIAEQEEDVDKAYDSFENGTAETDNISDESTVEPEEINNTEMANSENFDELMGNYWNKEEELNQIISELSVDNPALASYNETEASSYENILNELNWDAATPATDTIESQVVEPLTNREDRETATRINVNERVNDYDDWYWYPDPQYIDDTYVDETIYDVGDTINDYEDNIKNPFEIKKKEWPLSSRGWYDTTRIGRH